MSNPPKADAAQGPAGNRVLEWPGVPEAVNYRLCRRPNPETKGQTIYIGADPRCVVVSGECEPQDQYRIEVLRKDAGDYVTLIPYMSLPSEDVQALVIKEGEDAPHSVWQISIRTEDGVVLEQGNWLRPCFAVDKATLPENKRMRYRLRWWDLIQQKWNSWGGWRDLRQGGEPAAARRWQNHGDGTDVVLLVTVDTEANLRLMRDPDLSLAIDQQIYGRWGDRVVGIERMMDMFDQHGIKGTFFLDILMEHQFGQGVVENIIGVISDRGHDVQFHLHPTPHLFFHKDERLRNDANNIFRRQDRDAFARILDHGMELFQARVGRAPVAFRKGAYRIHDCYFDELKRVGIRYDSTVYPFKNCWASPWVRGRTQPFEVVPGLWEVPVSWLISRPGRAEDNASCYQYTSNLGSTQEAMAQGMEALASMPGERARFVVGMLHSYSFLHAFRTRDEAEAHAWNGKAALVPPKGALASRTVGEECKFFDAPEDSRIEAVNNFLGPLAGRPKVRGISFSDLARDHDRYLSPPPLRLEPVVEYDRGARKSRLTACRRYDLSYLACLEAEARNR